MQTFRDAWLDFCLQVHDRGKDWEGRKDVHYNYAVEWGTDGQVEHIKCTRLAVAGLTTTDPHEIDWALNQQRWAESMRGIDANRERTS